MTSARYGLRCLRDIGAALGLPAQTIATKTPTSYHAQRAFSTTLQRKDANLELAIMRASGSSGSAQEDAVVSGGDGGEPPAETDDRQTARKYPVLRAVPASPSYFARTALFYDNFVAIQELTRKYARLPRISREHAEQVSWKSKEHYRQAMGEKVSGRDFSLCMSLVKSLHLIHPDLMPPEVEHGLQPFKRSVSGYSNKAKPIQIDRFGRAHAVGRRKTSVSRAWVVEGTGEVIINGKPITEVFGRTHDRESALWALKSMERIDKYNVWATCEGGGTTGQAEALAMAIGKALVAHEPALKSRVRKAGCLTRDTRVVERKKPGHRKARKSPAWVKR